MTRKRRKGMWIASVSIGRVDVGGWVRRVRLIQMRSRRLSERNTVDAMKDWRAHATAQAAINQFTNTKRIPTPLTIVFLLSSLVTKMSSKL